MNILIDEACEWWRLWSVRLAGVAGLVAAYLAANPEQTQSLLGLLPDGPMRSLAAAGVGLFVFALATGTRLARQPAKKIDQPANNPVPVEETNG